MIFHKSRFASSPSPHFQVTCPAAAVNAQGGAPNETGSRTGFGSYFDQENQQTSCKKRRHDAQENANVLKNGEIRQTYSIFFRVVQGNRPTPQRQQTPQLLSFGNAAGKKQNNTNMFLANHYTTNHSSKDGQQHKTLDPEGKHY